MAWPYNKSWAGKQAGNDELGSIHAALYRAINERLDAREQSTVTWNYNGGTKEYPSAAELAGMAIRGAAINSNIAKIRTQLTVLAGMSFYTDSGFGTAITSLSQLLGLGSYGTSLPSSNFNVTFYLQVAEALEKLRYWKPGVIVGNGAIHTTGGESQVLGYSTLQLAWDNHDDIDLAGVSVPAGGLPALYWFVSRDDTIGESYRAGVASESYQEYTIPDYAGTIIDAKLGYIERTAGDTSPPGSIEVDLEGAAITVDTNEQTGLVDVSPTLNSTFTATASITTSEPSAVPFDSPADGTRNRLGLDFQNLQIYMDIASVLTDQA